MKALLKSWRLKACLVILFKAFPFLEKLLHRPLQSTFGKRPTSTQMQDRLTALKPLIDIASQNELIRGKRLCEFGAGRYPLLPYLFAKMGAKNIIPTDLNRQRLDFLSQPCDDATTTYLIN